jgi:drug/metabolite transporter (DMT)-like permease
MTRKVGATIHRYTGRMLWMFSTVIAAAAQTARNAMQRGLTASLGTLGATQVRFFYGLPFALLFLAIAVLATHATVPASNARFLVFTAGGGLAQILATALLLRAMQQGSFSVATALSKTEAVQIAVFGLVILGDHITPLRGAAIAIATFGVALTALKKGEQWTAASLRPALLGVAAGGCFALAAVGFRGGILALGDGPWWLRATTTLVWSLGIQTLVLGGYMVLLARNALIQSLRLWRPSLLAGFFGALASQFWFIGFSLTSAANVRTLGLVEVLFAQLVGQHVMRQKVTPRELLGMGFIGAGVGLLVAAS